MNTNSITTVSIQGTDVQRVTYHDEPVVTLDQIDRVHERASGTARRNYNANKKRFVAGVDYFEPGSYEIRTMSKNGVFPQGTTRGTLITRKGYLKLVKSLNDDVAWEVFDEMIDRYFMVEAIKLQTSFPIADYRIAREIRLSFKHNLKLATLNGLQGNQALIAANQALVRSIGFNMLDAMGLAHLPAPEQDRLLTPSEIGVRLGGKSAIWVNQRLAELGYQIGHKDKKGRPYWEPTEKGLEFARLMDTGKRHGDGTPVQQLKWRVSVLDAVNSETSH